MEFKVTGRFYVNKEWSQKNKEIQILFTDLYEQRILLLQPEMN